MWRSALHARTVVLSSKMQLDHFTQCTEWLEEQKFVGLLEDRMLSSVCQQLWNWGLQKELAEYTWESASAQTSEPVHICFHAIQSMSRDWKNHLKGSNHTEPEDLTLLEALTRIHWFMYTDIWPCISQEEGVWESMVFCGQNQNGNSDCKRKK